MFSATAAAGIFTFQQRIEEKCVSLEKCPRIPLSRIADFPRHGVIIVLVICLAAAFVFFRIMNQRMEMGCLHAVIAIGMGDITGETSPFAGP